MASLSIILHVLLALVGIKKLQHVIIHKIQNVTAQRPQLQQQNNQVHHLLNPHKRQVHQPRLAQQHHLQQHHLQQHNLPVQQAHLQQV